MQSRFAAQHVARVAKLSKALYHALIEQDGGEFLARTGALVRDRHLRTKRNRVCLPTNSSSLSWGWESWPIPFLDLLSSSERHQTRQGKYGTFYMEQVCVFSMHSFGCPFTLVEICCHWWSYSVPQVWSKITSFRFRSCPVLTWMIGLKGQANLLQNMSKNARRNAKNLSSKSAGSMGDAVATMPYNAEDIWCPINSCVKPVDCPLFNQTASLHPRFASCIPLGRPRRASRFAARRWRWWCSGSLAWIDLLDRSYIFFSEVKTVRNWWLKTPI